MNHPAPNSTESDYGHYHTAGTGLIIVGLINVLVALYSIIQGSQNTFIDYQTMLAFAVSFVMIGAWMRSLQ